VLVLPQRVTARPRTREKSNLILVLRSLVEECPMLGSQSHAWARRAHHVHSALQRLLFEIEAAETNNSLCRANHVLVRQRAVIVAPTPTPQQGVTYPRGRRVLLVLVAMATTLVTTTLSRKALRGLVAMRARRLSQQRRLWTCPTQTAFSQRTQDFRTGTAACAMRAAAAPTLA
jgi:hypothetical protein